MDNPIDFYTNPLSRGRMVRWMLEECSASYQVHLLDFATGAQKAAEYLAVNPMGKVPAIVHQGTVVTETPAIIAYLADAFPAANLAPSPQDPARGAYYRWLFFGAGCIDPALSDRLLHRQVPELAGPGGRGTLGYGSYESVVDTLERAVDQGPYLLGEQFTAADVYLASQIGWGLMAKALPASETLSGYLKRCGSRPAAQRAREADNALAQQLAGPRA